MIGKKRLCALLCAVLTLTQVVPAFAASESVATTKLKSSMFKGWTVSEDLVYNGESQVKDPVLKVSDNTLVEGVDYTVSYKIGKKTVSAPDVVNAGTVKVVIKGTGAYSGSITKTFKIAKRSIEGDAEHYFGDDFAFATPATATFGEKPDFALYYKGEELGRKDIAVKITGFGKVGADKCVTTVKGKGNFTGKVVFKRNVDQKSLADANVTITAKDVTFVSANNAPRKGKKNLSKVTVKVGKKTVKASNYDVEYFVSGNKITASANFAAMKPGTEVTDVVTAKDGKSFVGVAATTYYLSGSLLKAKDVKAAEGATYDASKLPAELITVKGVDASEYDVTIIDTKANRANTKTKVKFQITGKGVVGGTVVKTIQFKNTPVVE